MFYLEIRQKPQLFCKSATYKNVEHSAKHLLRIRSITHYLSAFKPYYPNHAPSVKNMPARLYISRNRPYLKCFEPPRLKSYLFRPNLNKAIPPRIISLKAPHRRRHCVRGRHHNRPANSLSPDFLPSSHTCLSAPRAILPAMPPPRPLSLFSVCRAISPV